MNEEKISMEEKCCFSLILSGAAFIFSLLLTFPCLPRLLSNDELQFDYIGAMIGVLSILTALLIGWNIYQLIDLKSYKKQMAHLKRVIHRDQINIYNKIDYNSGLMYGFNAQNIACILSKGSKELLKMQMLLHGIESIIMLSNKRKFKECNAIIGSLISTLEQTNEITISIEEKKTIIEMSKRINNRDKIDNIDKFCELIKNCLVS